jgi:hypothetical protein
MHTIRLSACHPDRPVPSLALTGFSDRRLALHSHPEHRQSLERPPQAGLGITTVEEDLIDDDAGPGPGDRGQPLVPGRLGRAERVPDDDRAVRRDLE